MVDFDSISDFTHLANCVAKLTQKRALDYAKSTRCVEIGTNTHIGAQVDAIRLNGNVLRCNLSRSEILYWNLVSTLDLELVSTERILCSTDYKCLHNLFAANQRLFLRKHVFKIFSSFLKNVLKNSPCCKLNANTTYTRRQIRIQYLWSYVASGTRYMTEIFRHMPS